MDHFAMLTSNEQLVKHKNLKMILHNSLYSIGYIFQDVLSRTCETFCGTLKLLV